MNEWLSWSYHSSSARKPLIIAFLYSLPLYIHGRAKESMLNEFTTTTADTSVLDRRKVYREQL